MPTFKYKSQTDNTLLEKRLKAVCHPKSTRTRFKLFSATGPTMNSLSVLSGTILLLFLLGACNKDDENPASSSPGSDFPKNTAWTGTFNYTKFGTNYPQPCCIKFKDSKAVMYGVIQVLYGGALRRYDSLIAVVKGSENTDAGLKVDLEFELIKESTSILIADKKKLNSSGPGSFTFNLELFDKEVPLPGTSWSGHVMHGGPLEGLYAYPDLSSIFFYLDNKVPMAGHKRGGNILYNKPYGQQDPIQSAVFQHGPIIYMDGFNESQGIGVFVPYFGVLIGNGNQMLVEARDHTFARLPSYLATIDWFGPKGMTPALSQN